MADPNDETIEEAVEVHESEETTEISTETTAEAPKTASNSFLNGVEKVKFHTPNIDAEAEEMANTEKQNYKSSGTSTASNPGTTTEKTDASGKPIDPPPAGKKDNKQSAERIAKVGDKLVAFICTMISGDEDSTVYRAKKTEVEEMADEIEVALNESGKEIKFPWWASLLLVAFFAYGDKIKMAVKRKREKKKPVVKAPTNYSNLQPQPHKQETTVETYVESHNDNGTVVMQKVETPAPQPGKCLLPGCDMPAKKKFCCASHAATYNAKHSKNMGRKKGSKNKDRIPEELK